MPIRDRYGYDKRAVDVNKIAVIQGTGAYSDPSKRSSMLIIEGMMSVKRFNFIAAAAPVLA
jgi:hypothetical protein